MIEIGRLKSSQIIDIADMRRWVVEDHGHSARYVNGRDRRGLARPKRRETFHRTVLALVRAHYPDFGPTLAVEQLAARHGLRLGVETLRQWMIADGLWIDRRHQPPSPHQPRRRRECLGELVQIDGSEHAWFEDRGDICTLLAFVDDATSRLMQRRLVVSESAFDYFCATRSYREAHGKPNGQGERIVQTPKPFRQDDLPDWAAKAVADTKIRWG